MTLQILDSAIEDLRQGREFYESQGEGLGDYFLHSLSSEIDSLTLYAGVHRLVFGYHRLLARRFPYAIYYQLEAGENCVVWRVLDLRQSPKNLRRAL